MVQRRRGGDFGLMLLAGQVLSYGLENIPPATLALLAGQTAIFLNMFPQFFPSPNNVCISSYLVYQHRDWRRLILATFYHAHDMHLYYNMVSLLYKGSRLERKYGTPYFAYMVAVFSALTSATYVGLGIGLSTILRDESYLTSCAVGFSGVLFALKVLVTHDSPDGMQYALGFIPVPSRYIFWAELALIQLITPNASFVGHLAGILVGLAYVKGPLKLLMDAFLPPDDGDSRRSSFADSVSEFFGRPRSPRFGQSPRYGHSSRYDYYQYSPPPSAPPSEDWSNNEAHHQNDRGPVGFERYTGGLSEEEQYRRAMEESRRQNGLYPDLDDLRDRRRNFYQ